MNARSITPLPGVSKVVDTVNSEAGATRATTREIMVETPVALVFNGTTAAVMMATPADIEDFAHGFALTEGYIAGLSDIESFETHHHASGIEARFWVTDERAEAIAERRRMIAGPVGCGLCGIDSLDQVHRALSPVIGQIDLTEDKIAASTTDIKAWQPLKDLTRSTHAAGFYLPGQGIIAAREDVGRHNALDKLIGALAQGGEDASRGAMVLTSRVSVELVQKCAVSGAPMLIAASGPTSLAIETARTLGVTLIGFCRDGRFERFT
ncbi:MAG: formate dehydrogenase accessory sulfurtransferase FdhD [Pseudomonadota bacterium]